MCIATYIACTAAILISQKGHAWAHVYILQDTTVRQDLWPSVDRASFSQANSQTCLMCSPTFSLYKSIAAFAMLPDLRETDRKTDQVP